MTQFPQFLLYQIDFKESPQRKVSPRSDSDRDNFGIHLENWERNRDFVLFVSPSPFLWSKRDRMCSTTSNFNRIKHYFLPTFFIIPSRWNDVDSAIWCRKKESKVNCWQEFKWNVVGLDINTRRRCGAVVICISGLYWKWKRSRNFSEQFVKMKTNFEYNSISTFFLSFGFTRSFN